MKFCFNECQTSEDRIRGNETLISTKKNKTNYDTVRYSSYKATRVIKRNTVENNCSWRSNNNNFKRCKKIYN